MRYLLAVLCFISLTATRAQHSQGIFEAHVDVGNPKKTGSALYIPETKSYVLTGGGYNIWFERDEFHFLYSQLQGDFILTATFEFIGVGKDPHRKVGWMLRSSLADNASHISAVSHGDGLVVLQWRVSQGAAMRDPEDEIFFPKKNLKIIQLERKDKLVTMRVGNPGEPLETVGSHSLESLPDHVFAGLYICSHNPELVEQANVSNVRIEKIQR